MNDRVNEVLYSNSSAYTAATLHKLKLSNENIAPNQTRPSSARIQQALKDEQQTALKSLSDMQRAVRNHSYLHNDSTLRL